ncbi:MAG: HD domain-containing protein [Oscillospiraceae bacterium]|nr:HD domain-containing protein [Oscillospiraceae bacterium]
MNYIKNTILIVDDVELNRVILTEAFKDDYTILESDNGETALKLIAEHKDSIAAVLLDILMPVMNGFEVLQKLNDMGLVDKIPIFLITAYDSEESLISGYNLGAMDIISKPIIPYFVKKRVNSIVELFRSREQLQDECFRQQDMLHEQALEIQSLNHSMIETLATAIEFHSCESGEHVRRIRDITNYMMNTLSHLHPDIYNFDDNQIELVSTAAVLHDVGKIAISDVILNKPGRLTDEEFEIMKTHTLRGCDLLHNIPKIEESPIYEYAYDICRHHHERWDGRGYPDRLKGDEISIYAQIVSIADVYEALTSKRVYKPAFTHEKAFEMILNGECGQFNPILLEGFKEISDKLKVMAESHKDIIQNC